MTGDDDNNAICRDAHQPLGSRNNVVFGTIFDRARQPPPGGDDRANRVTEPRDKRTGSAHERQRPWARQGRSIRGRSAERAANVRGGVLERTTRRGLRGFQTDRPANTSRDVVSRARNRDAARGDAAETMISACGRRPGERFRNKIMDSDETVPSAEFAPTTTPSSGPVRSRAHGCA